MIKSKAKKLTCLLLAGMLGTSTFALSACGGKKKVDNSPNTLEIFYWNSGYGDAWLNKVVKKFEKMYPNITIDITASADNTTWKNDLKLESNTTDLYIATLPELLAYTDYLEPLDDIFYSAHDEDGDLVWADDEQTELEWDDSEYLTWEGEDTSLFDKQNHTILNSLRDEDGNLYAGMWGSGVCGIIYNATKFESAIEEGDIECIPRTTDELIEVATFIADGLGETPFMHCSNADYWNYALLPWFGQYSGTDGVMDLWNGVYVDEDGERHELDVRSQLVEGKRLALEVFYDCVAPTGFTWEGSNTKKHTAAQTEFLNGRAWMMPNGNWLENEMKNVQRDNDDEFMMMKTPITSKLLDQLDSIEDDYVLREVIDYVDGVDEDAPDGVSEEDIERVREARNVVYTEGASYRCIVPKYSTAKAYAKLFIQYLQSDEALNIFAKETGQYTTVASTTPIDTDDWSPFAQSCAALMNSNSDYVFRSKGHPLFYNGVFAEAFPTNPYAQEAFTSKEKVDSAETFWNTHVAWVENNWEKALKLAGLA